MTFTLAELRRLNTSLNSRIIELKTGLTHLTPEIQEQHEAETVELYKLKARIVGELRALEESKYRRREPEEEAL